jgi:hypothetical protein
MALASRSARGGGAGRRWLLIGVIITLLVLLIDAALQSRSPAPGQQLAAGAWIDRVLPIVTTSTSEGQQIAGIWNDALQTPATSLSAQLDQVAAGSAGAYKEVVALHPPVNLAGAAGLLEACLLTRSQAASALRAALGPILEGGAGTPPTTTTPGATTASTGLNPDVAAIQTVGNDIQISDRAYQLFLQNLPNLPQIGITLPASKWAADPTPYQPDQAQLFLTSLQNAMRGAPVHQLKIDSVSLIPAPVSLQGATQVVPNSPAIGVTVVVADVGNQPEKNVTVTAAIASRGNSSSVRDFASLTPGQAQTIQGMGPLSPPQGVPVTLRITATPGFGSSTPVVSRTLTFVMAGSPPSTPTTVPASAKGTAATSTPSSSG